MELIEREQNLSELKSLLKVVSEGTGHIAAVCGEAGIGKTSLVEAFTLEYQNNIKILWGACDDLFTPRPLAPLYDIAGQLNSRIASQLDSGVPRPSVFTNFFKEIQSSEPIIIVIEDMHWADESTLDFLKFMGKRINKIKVLLIITYRDDELRSDHPLKLSLSSFPASNFKRIKLAPLTTQGIRKLVGNSGKSEESLYHKTGGNPFLLTELLSNTEAGIPVTVKDLIGSKLFRLSPDARYAVELISVIPGRTEKWLLEDILTDLSVLDEPIDFGILKTEHDAVSFRHELGRMSVEESLQESKREKLNSIVLDILLKQKGPEYSLSRIIHHASKAMRSAEIIKYAPLAAKQASKLGAHIQAAKIYSIALLYSHNLGKEQLLDLLEGKSYECYLTGQIQEGIKACESINDILKNHTNLQREGENYRRLSRLLWFAGEDDKGEEYLRKAINIFEETGAGKELAMAYSNLSQVLMCREETNPAVEWGQKAVAFAQKINDLDIEMHALCNIGSAKMFAGDPSGEDDMKRTLEVSLKNDFHDHASRTYANIGSAYLYRRNLPEADKYFSAGFEYCNEKDLFTHGLCISAEIAKTKLYMGKYDEAAEYAGVIFKHDNVPVIDQVISLCIIGVIRARRDDPGSLPLLEQAVELALKSGELMKIVTAECTLAEAYWLKNKLHKIIERIETVYDKYKDNSNKWAVGELAFWLWKGESRAVFSSDKIAEPFYLQISGKWDAAAELWKNLNCPYEQALALCDGDEEAMKKAVVIFDKLGASAASQLIKHKMREAGFKKVPKGPRKSTSANPSNLTKRQLDVIKLLTEGLSNSEIAEKLFISPKTVDHHISAIFAKLNIHSRTEAAAYFHSSVINKI